MQFLQFIQVDIIDVTYSAVLAFIEFLQFNGLSGLSIQAYISSLRAQFKFLGLSTSSLGHYAVSLAIRSILINVPFPKRVKGILDLVSLQAITSKCDALPLGYIYKPVFLLSFFAFLRLSNLVPPSLSSFSSAVHLCRGDVIFHPEFATLVLKWTKTLQKQSQFATVQLPSLGASPLCPISALQNMMAIFPLPPNAPLFSIPQGSSFVPLTQSKVRKCFSSILTALDIDPSSHTFHCLRRSGASLAFNSDVSLQAIQHHGTWSSDAVWTYILKDPQCQGSVASTFKKLLHY